LAIVVQGVAVIFFGAVAVGPKAVSRGILRLQANAGSEVGKGQVEGTETVISDAPVDISCKAGLHLDGGGEITNRLPVVALVDPSDTAVQVRQGEGRMVLE